MATLCKIDGVLLTNDPSHIRVIQPQVKVYPTAGSGKIVVQPLTPPTIEVRWGDHDIALPAVIAELKAKRGNTLVHVLSWPTEDNSGYYHYLVYMPQIGLAQGPYQEVVDTFTLVCEVVNINSAAMTEVTLAVAGTVSVGDAADTWVATGDATIMFVTGTITTLGTGTGQTRVQLREGTTDYLATRGDFVVATQSGQMQNQVLAWDNTIANGQTLNLDIDGIPSGADSAGLSVKVYLAS